jgi:uncharacterized membrane protein YoaT (DUF817 family)
MGFKRFDLGTGSVEGRECRPEGFTGGEKFAPAASRTAVPESPTLLSDRASAASRSRVSPLYEFWIFGVKEARACAFAGTFLGILLVSRYLPLGDLPRYDFILIGALVIQVALLALRIETFAEAAVLAVFHLLGLGLELFKTHPSIGSWSYPEEAWTKFYGVPLYSGFMYAAVASYMCQAWRIMRLRLTGYPPHALSIALSVAIYANFFTHHFIGDYRWWLMGAVLLVFARTRVHFTVVEKERTMPLVVSFLLIGFFVWVAENLATLFGAWVYPNQQKAWALVSTSKISSWALLVIVTFIIVADLKHVREGDAAVRR